MPILVESDYSYPLPSMVKIRQCFASSTLKDVKSMVTAQMRKDEIRSRIKPGMRVAIGVGSRGINNLELIVRTVINEIKQCGAEPFIVSAMGSHGGGTEDGQREVLESYGITEENLGIDVVTTVDVESIGKTTKGYNVFFDRAAYNADLIVPINRVKLHTDFVGELQSGICKMLVIGLGNHIGCSAIHEEDPEVFAQILEEAANIIIKETKVGFGVAVLENAYDKTMDVEIIPADKIIVREKELIKISIENMPTLPVESIDVLVVEEIGKNISGAGFDPNIIGRSSVLKKFVLKVPEIKKMVLLDITAQSHGNGIGMGMFDVITKNVFSKLNLENMYANAIACKCIEDAKIPVMVNSEEEAIRVALKVCREIDWNKVKIVKIKNTLDLEEFWVSECLLPELLNNPNLVKV